MITAHSSFSHLSHVNFLLDDLMLSVMYTTQNAALVGHSSAAAEISCVQVLSLHAICCLWGDFPAKRMEHALRTQLGDSSANVKSVCSSQTQTKQFGSWSPDGASVSQCNGKFMFRDSHSVDYHPPRGKMSAKIISAPYVTVSSSLWYQNSGELTFVQLWIYFCCLLLSLVIDQQH